MLWGVTRGVENELFFLNIFPCSKLMNKVASVDWIEIDHSIKIF